MEVDILLFMGQSNMAGRGNWREAPAVIEGAAYEYRAVTRPGELVELTEPFGAGENRVDGVFEPGMKTGSMVASFVNTCYEKTGRPIVAVSCSKGGSSIEEWEEGSPYFMDAVKRYKDCVSYLNKAGIAVHFTGMVWCQGCTDGDGGMKKGVYKQKTMDFFDCFLSMGVEKIFLIQIGNQRENADLYKPMQDAQTEMAEESEDIIMVSEAFKTFRDRGLMKDSYHYKQEAYNLVGKEAGERTGEYLAGK